MGVGVSVGVFLTHTHTPQDRAQIRPQLQHQVRVNEYVREVLAMPCDMLLRAEKENQKRMSVEKS